jgi:glutamate-1-semialdehyde 2,1-aminomutase
MDFHESQNLFERAQRVIPGGVNSPVRAFRAVGGTPPFIARAAGAFVYDADGNEYVDYVGSWGPAILGHAHPTVISAVRDCASLGLSFGAPTAQETRLAEIVIDRYPSIQMLRCVSSGTEATMSAVRVARGHTGRHFIVKFAGAYHGHSDGMLAKAGSGVGTLGIADSAGVPGGVVQYTLTLPYNDKAALLALFQQRGLEIAAVIVEPVAGNMGCVPPAPGFLDSIISLCTQSGAISIFDEVMTGCRVSRGGAQALYGLMPDMTCLGKVVGGGMPLAIYGGRREIMTSVAPLGPVYQAGTLSGNPIAVTAGIATLELLEESVYEKLEDLSAALELGLKDSLRRHGMSGVVERVGSMLTLFFCAESVTDYETACKADRARFARWHRGLLQRGVYWPPSQLEAAFVSAAHTRADIDRTLTVADAALLESAR